MRKIGLRLRELRKECGYKAEEAARKLYVSTPTLCNIEKGTTIPRIDFLFSIAEVYGVSIEEIIEVDKEASENMRKYDIAKEEMSTRLLLDGKPLSEMEWYWFVNMVRSYRQMKGGSA